jgi:hypothetical protein
VTEWYEADKARLDTRSRALHEIEHGGNALAGHGRLHRRSHRPLPSRHDGASEGGLRPPHVGGRHPAPALLGHGFEQLKAGRRILSRRKDGCKGCWVMPSRKTAASETTGPPNSRGGTRRGRAAREGHRAIERDRHVRRQGHRQSVLEVRFARPRLLLSRVRRRNRAVSRCGRRRPTATATNGVPSFGARRPSTT